MFTQILHKPLTLNIDGNKLTFRTPADFDFALNCRVELPGGKFAALVSMDADSLVREAKSIRDVEKGFIDVLTRSLEDPATMGRLFRSIDEHKFSSDHQWREIMAALRDQSPEFDEFKRLALAKYTQYLRSRQIALKTIHANRRTESDEIPTDREVSGDLRDTQLFSTADIVCDEYTQLPRGETVEVRLGVDGELPIMLSRHPFRLIKGEEFCLIADDTGQDFPLREGKNILGRMQGNQVVLNSGYRDVSRKHLVVEAVDDKWVRLTDLSAHGTFVPALALAVEAV